MSSTSENYLFLGLHASGKTTYFVLMAQHLQDVANRSRKLRFRYLSTLNMETGEEEEITQKFIYDGIDQLRKQRWPKKTEGYEHGYSFELEVCSRFLGVPLFYRRAMIDYHDYPGEAYEVAFGFDNNSTSEVCEIAQNLKERIATARGIFLNIDTNSAFNGEDDPKSREILTKLFRHIQKSNPALKLAVIFNKLELFGGKEPDFEQLFRKKYSNAYAYLPSNFRFFKVYPLGDVETAEDGIVVIPPRILRPRNILAPVQWMFNI